MSQEREAEQANKESGADNAAQESQVEMSDEGTSSDELETTSEQHSDDQMSFEQAQIQALEEELAKANATIEEQKDGVLRARADMENARRRAEQEVDKARKFALEKFAGELLPIIDNLERAMQSADASQELVKPLLDGVELTHKSFISTVEKFGMQVVDPQGEAFNPDHHQAMSMQESDEFEPNTVMAVMQKGYVLNGRLLRPAMVMVSRASSDGIDTQA
ncbi:nucleotide exchange factor GrpE [Ningiella sp. W23]|uniref:nucleotide exchange factor GrpE n=1 Tax=Ningiella sp. W23 TaxID=3023715 RepID=UPI003757D1FD